VVILDASLRRHDIGLGAGRPPGWLSIGCQKKSRKDV
jgi:hypothetical protein